MEENGNQNLFYPAIKHTQILGRLSSEDIIRM